VAGFQRTRRFDDERFDVFAPGGGARQQADAVGSYPLYERCGIEIRALWQAPVPAGMAFALKQTLCRSVKLSGSNSAGMSIEQTLSSLARFVGVPDVEWP
jgi:hypothetical protein